MLICLESAMIKVDIHYINTSSVFQKNRFIMFSMHEL